MLSTPGLLAETPGKMTHPIKVEVVGSDGKYQLLRGGKPYHIKGAGASGINLASLAARGGNSIRTWSADNASQLLDAAYELGMTVSLCLYTKPERSGFDYDDEAAVQKQFKRIKEEVLRYKDHPALLFWIIGNELNHDYQNPKVYDAVNDISLMIHEVDPYHPTTTTLAGFSADMLAVVNDRAADLDFLSIQVYGMLFALPELIEKAGFTGPFAITEWGARGIGRRRWKKPAQKKPAHSCAVSMKLSGHLESSCWEITYSCGGRNRRKHQPGTACSLKVARKPRWLMLCITSGMAIGPKTGHRASRASSWMEKRPVAVSNSLLEIGTMRNLRPWNQMATR
jgi:hypothetical protein